MRRPGAERGLARRAGALRAAPARPALRPRDGAVVRATAIDVPAVQRLQAAAGNRAVATLLHPPPAHRRPAPSSRAAVQRAPQPPQATKDRAVDVVEAIVHVMSNRGLSGDVGPNGENVSSPRYATEVTKTVTEPEHVALLWVWYLIAVADPITHGDAAKVAESHAKTARLIAAMRADKAAAKRAAGLEARYLAGYEQLSQRAAREQAEQMIDVGVAEAQRPQGRVAGTGDAELLAAVQQARQALLKWNGVLRRVVSQQTTARQTAALQERSYKHHEAVFWRQVDQGLDPALPWPKPIERAGGMGFPDGVHLLQGGLDAVTAILSVADPKARAQLFSARSNYFGAVAQGADINKVMWQFVSGSIAVGGAGAYGVAKLAGNVKLAEGVLDAAVRGVANVNAAMNLAGVVHGTFVLLDPDSTANEKAAAAVEVAYSAIGIAGFAARWTPRLASMARWSGPISASLMINFEIFKRLANLRHKAQVGLSRLDWVTCYRTTKAAAVEVQSWQRRLAVANAILATEKDGRRRIELQKYAAAFRSELIERQLTPFLKSRLASTSMDDDAASCGPAFTRRLRPVEGQLAGAAASDDAALAAAGSFLLVVEKAFTEWDQIVMER